jgi:hypothetical protein
MTIVTREEASEASAEYKEIFDKEWHHDHEIIRDANGTLRWKQDPKVREIIDKGILNDLWYLFHTMGLTKNSEEVRKIYRDMGYSLFGYWEIFFWEMNNENAKLYRKGKRKKK